MEEIREQYIPLEQLQAHSANYKKHPQKQLAKLIKSLKRFGQVRNIVAKEDAPGRYTIVAGHGLVDAALQLYRENPVKYAHLATIRANIVPASWDDVEIRAYMVADNETGNDAVTDGVQLASLLEEQRNLGHDLEALGSSEQELADLLERLGDEALADGELEDDEELAPISEEIEPAEQLKNLKFGKYVVMLTDEEFLALEERYAAYTQEAGSNYGFVRSLLDVC